MSQHDYEKQPEAPDLGAAVQLNTSDTLEGPVGDIDGLDAGYSPPDRPYGLEDELTLASDRGERLDERLAREQPERLPVDLYRAGRLSDPDQGAALKQGDAMDAIDVGVDGGAASAEDAVHIVEVARAPEDRAHGHGAAPGGNSDRIPDESRTHSPDDPEGGLFEDEVVSRNRGSGRTGMPTRPGLPPRWRVRSRASGPDKPANSIPG